jgi:hypothetical protein
MMIVMVQSRQTCQSVHAITPSLPYLDSPGADAIAFRQFWCGDINGISPAGKRA